MQSVVKIDPEIMHGTPCFAGTRVPVQILFEWLEDDQTVDYFLEQFPSVKREQVLAVLEMSRQHVIDGAERVEVSAR